MEKLQIAKALKNTRNKANMTCKEVAAIIGNSEKTVSAWENALGQPDIGTLLKLCEIYKVSGVDEMLGHRPDENLLNALRQEEKDLINLYRELTINSKQIVMSVAQLELNHVHSVRQGEIPIRILQRTKEQVDADVKKNLKHRADSEKLLKVFNQSAAAGYGNYIDDDSFEMLAVPCIPQGTEFGIRISGDSMKPEINHGDIVFVTRQSSVDVGDIGIFIYDGDAYCKQLVYKDNAYFLHSLNNRYSDIPILGDSIFSVGKVLDSYHEED